jgi:hypothetical protein
MLLPCVINIGIEFDYMIVIQLCTQLFYLGLFYDCIAKDTINHASKEIVLKKLFVKQML